MKKRIAILLCLLLVFTMLPSTALAEGGDEGEPPADTVPSPTEQDPDGLIVYWNGAWIGGGEIGIPEGCGYSLQARLDRSVISESEFWYDVSSDNGICNAGFSPDNQVLEFYLSANAVAGDRCAVTVLYGEQQAPSKAEFTVIVTPSVSLKLTDGTIIKPNGKIRGYDSVTAQLMLGNTLITGEYTIGQKGINSVYSLTDDKKGALTITTIGKGSNEFSVSYGGQTYSYTWVGTEIDKDTEEKTYSLKIDYKTKNAGESFYFNTGKNFEIDLQLNGLPCKSGYKIELKTDYIDTDEDRPDKDRQAQITENAGAYSLGTGSYIGRYELIIRIGEGENTDAEIPFYIQVSDPTEYVLQFYNIEKVNDYWENTGFATFGVFKSYSRTIDTKFVVTDQNMRLVDDEHFVEGVANAENWKVQYWDPFADNGSGNYVAVKDKENPFGFAAITDGKNKDENMVRISYDPSKDKHGPIYSVEYAGSDSYLNTKDANIENVSCNVLLYTRKMADIFDWEGDKHGHDGHHHYYHAYLKMHGGMEQAGFIDDNGSINNEDCDVRSTSVEIPQTIFGTDEGKITVSAEPRLDIETDIASISFDSKVLGVIAGKETDVTLDVVKLEDEDKDSVTYVGMGLNEYELVLDFSLSSGETQLIPETSAENNGNVTVKLEYTAKDASKTPKVYYIDQSGNKTEVECTYENGTISFDTKHFSVFAVEEVAVTDSGSGGSGSTGSGSSGGGAIGAGTGSSTEIGATDAKTEEELKAEQLEQAQQGAAKAAMKARSSKTSKGNVKVVFIPDEETEGFIKEMKALGYTVKYKFYRSTKKTSGYKAMLTKSSRSYTNTSGVKGRMYYYKARVQIFDRDGKLIAQTALKQCKYANRIFG